MRASRFRSLIAGGLVLALLLPAVVVPWASADEGHDGADHGGKSSIRWIEGWEAGSKAAREQGRLAFVYVGRHEPPCPPCRALDRMVFQDPDSARIHDEYVAVRMLGGVDSTPATEAFMRRYGIDGFPTLLVLTADGEVVMRDFRPPNGASLLDAMKQATEAETSFRAQAKELEGKEDVESAKSLAKLHMQRSSLEKALEIYRTVAKRESTAENHEMVAGLLSVLERDDEEKKLLLWMVDEFPDHEERIEWRVSLATIDIPTRVDDPAELPALLERHSEALRGLLAKVEKEGKPAAVAAVRYRLGRFAQQSGDPETFRTHMDWVVANDPKGKWTGRARMDLAVTEFQAGALDKALVHLEAILANHPDMAEEAQQAIAFVKQQMADRAPPAEDAEEGDEAPDEEAPGEAGEETEDAPAPTGSRGQ
jgi:tetratricopeptide (TPR) repeat protein